MLEFVGFLWKRKGVVSGSNPEPFCIPSYPVIWKGIMRSCIVINRKLVFEILWISDRYVFEYNFNFSRQSVYALLLEIIQSTLVEGNTNLALQQSNNFFYISFNTYFPSFFNSTKFEHYNTLIPHIDPHSYQLYLLMQGYR